MQNSLGSPPASMCMNLWTALNSDSDSLSRKNLSINSSQRIFTSLLSEQILKKKSQNDSEIRRLLDNVSTDCDRQRSMLLDFDKEISIELGTQNDQISQLKQNEQDFGKNVDCLEYWRDTHAGRRIEKLETNWQMWKRWSTWTRCGQSSRVRMTRQVTCSGSVKTIRDLSGNH